jgi:hypothetical protein
MRFIMPCLTFPPDDAAALAAAMERLAGDPALSATRAEKSIQLYLGPFNRDRLARAYEEALKAVAG